MVSRVLGLVREIVTAQLFGTSGALSLFLMAFTIPNLFRRLFGEGAMHAAFIPVFTRATENSEAEARRLFRVVHSTLAATLFGVTLIGWVGCGAAWLLGGLSEDGRLFCLLLGIMLPYLPMICLSALEAATLNVRGRFFVPALAPALMNVCWIAAVWFFGREYGVTALAVGVAVSGFLQYAVQVPMLWRERMSIAPALDWANAGLRRAVRLMGPVAIGVGVFQINVLVDRVIAWFCVPGEGAVSILNYANRLMQLPLGVLGLALVTAVFPALARSAAKEDRRQLLRTNGMALRLGLFMALPCMAVLIALREPIVRVLFQRGAFDAVSAQHTRAALLYYSLGLPAFCCAHVVTRAFYALEDTATPVRVAAWMVGANFVLNLALVWPMQESGLALASSLTAYGTLVFLLALLGKKLGPLGLQSTALNTVRSGFAACVAGISGWAIWKGMSFRTGLGERFGAFGAETIALGMALTAVGIAYLVASWLLGSKDVRDFVGMVRRLKRAP